jgi:23S rRNA (guanine745-N1)-methyltransferase
MLTFKNKTVEESLVCPICKSRMEIIYENSGRLQCKGPRTHSYDFASGGYVNLGAPVQSGGGDSKQAVRARSDFLNTGYYEPIANKLFALLSEYLSTDALVVDAGCGEGYYSERIAADGYSLAGFDLSKFAADAAAKRAKAQGRANALFGVASVFSLPLADFSTDAIVNIFAPRAEKEYARVLKDGGLLFVVAAGPDHLLGLKKAIYSEIHRNDVRADMPTEMKLIRSERLSYTITVNGNESIKNLFAMTPYYWKTSQSDVQKLEALESLETEIDINFEVYQKI